MPPSGPCAASRTAAGKQRGADGVTARARRDELRPIVRPAGHARARGGAPPRRVADAHGDRRRLAHVDREPVIEDRHELRRVPADRVQRCERVAVDPGQRALCVRTEVENFLKIVVVGVQTDEGLLSNDLSDLSIDDDDPDVGTLRAAHGERAPWAMPPAVSAARGRFVKDVDGHPTHHFAGLVKVRSCMSDAPRALAPVLDARAPRRLRL